MKTRLAVVAAAVVAMVAAPIVHADTFVLGGTGTQGAPSQASMEHLVTQQILAPDTLIGIDYPADLWPLTGTMSLDRSVRQGTDTLDIAIRTATDPITVLGISQGAVVINYEKRRLMADTSRPAGIRFVTVGDPTNSDGGVLAKLPPIYIPILDFTIARQPVDTPYDTLEIVREFDGFADAPDDPWNLLAQFNALAGTVFIHPNYGDVDIHDLANIVTTTTNSLGGTITHILVPTKDLPLTQIFRVFGVDDQIVDAFDRPLRRIINLAYDGTRPGEPAASEPAVRPLREESPPTVTAGSAAAPVLDKPKETVSDSPETGPPARKPRHSESVSEAGPVRAEPRRTVKDDDDPAVAKLDTNLDTKPDTDADNNTVRRPEPTTSAAETDDATAANGDEPGGSAGDD